MSFLSGLFHKNEPWKNTLLRDMFVLSFRDLKFDKDCSPIIEEIGFDVGFSASKVIKIFENMYSIPTIHPKDKECKIYYLRCLVRTCVAGGKKHEGSLDITLVIANELGLSSDYVADMVHYYT